MIPTFIITYGCNLGCNHCFQQGERAFHLPPMRLEDFVAGIKWLRRAGIGEIKVSGGEATGHPGFVAFLEAARALDMRIVLFTNGLFDFRRIPHFDVLSSAFVQVHPAFRLKPRLRDIIRDSVDCLQCNGVSVTLSYTITRAGHTREIIELAASLRRANLRIDLARFDLTRSNAHVPVADYQVYRAEIMDAVARGVACGVDVRLDCPLPLCLFSEAERESLEPHGLFGVCVPFPLINPDLSVGCCPYPGLLRNKLTEFAPRQLGPLLHAHPGLLELRWTRPPRRKCETCALWRGKKCQGGCIRGKPLLPVDAAYALPFLC